jgi:hypothetical protein
MTNYSYLSQMEFSEEFIGLMPTLSSEGGSYAPTTTYVSLETLRYTFTLTGTGIQKNSDSIPILLIMLIAP